MHCRVTQHREQGRPLKRTELAEPITGKLEWIRDPGSNGKRYAGVYFFGRTGVAERDTPVLSPLFDPVVISIKDGLMVLQGIQLVPGGIETVQVWSVEVIDGKL